MRAGTPADAYVFAHAIAKTGFRINDSGTDVPTGAGQRTQGIRNLFFC